MPDALILPPVALDRDLVVHLGADLEIATLAVTPAFFEHAPSDRPELSNGHILSVFDYTETWPYWERHPTGDELVYVVSGAVDFLLVDEHERRVATLRSGQATVVPTGAWHRAIIDVPSRLLFVTPTPARTEQRPVEAGDELQ